MSDTPTQLPFARRRKPRSPLRDVMQRKVTTVEPNDHVAAAAYLMKHAGATALVIVDPVTGQPVGIITETDIAHAVANGKNLEEVRIHDLMTTRPVVIDPATSVPDAARAMTGGRPVRSGRPSSRPSGRSAIRAVPSGWRRSSVSIRRRRCSGCAGRAPSRWRRSQP